MRTSDNMKGTLADIASLVKDEFKTISTSYAILLVLVGGIFLYGLLYNYMYAPDLVRNAPVVVVDDSKTDLSREYIRLLNATPQVSVIADGLDYAEAPGVDEGGGCRRYLGIFPLISRPGGRKE